MRRLLTLLPLLALAGLTSCTDSGPFVPSIESTNFAPELGVDLANSTRTASGLYYRDITVGGGAQVPAAGTTPVTVDYAGYLRSGAMFDDGTLDFTVGSGNMIAGFEEGVRGMKVGGQRQLIIPPSLGYGNQSRVGIPANSILIFVVTLTGIN